MTFSKARRQMGQAFLETLLGMTVLILTSFVGVVLILQGIGTLLASKWAAQNSRCIAIGREVEDCKKTCINEMESHFAFTKVRVTSRIFRGVIHSEIQG